MRLAGQNEHYWTSPVVRGSRDSISTLLADPSGNLLISGGQEGFLRLWKGDEQREIVWSFGHLADSPVALSADGQMAAWTAPEAMFRGAKAGEYKALSRPETQPAAWATHHRAVVFNIREKRIQFVVAGHTDEVSALALSSDGRRLAAGDNAGVIKLWDTSTGNELLSLNAHLNGVKKIAIHPFDKQLASLGLDGVLRIWHCE